MNDASLWNEMPVLDIEALASFVAIAEQGSFSLASADLQCAPSSITMRIKKLEALLGVSLFDRRSRAVTLSKNGEILLVYAKSILSLSDEAVVAITRSPFCGLVRIGTTIDLSETLLPPILKTLSRKYPSITIDVMIAEWRDLVRQQGDRSVDIAVFSCIENDMASQGELVSAEPLVWAERLGGRARRQPRLPLALGCQPCELREIALALLGGQGWQYRLAYESVSPSLQRVAVLSDHAIAPLPLSFMTSEMREIPLGVDLPKLPLKEIRLLGGGSEAAEAVQIICDAIRQGCLLV
ncbi:hypothetical protein ADU59_09815 [Pararhizobium polonicum]|uniref:HTH lysR-type domain-containing protein n=1 Tax=Pararhizobium polonicum TaxID=1612624 RepID=A0A1C7P368_9HYPH|nr:LysR family transcriptional regulator [Pararhizobium polonicum]OBZ95661.1 hypothetical protein ADU59_09815 [Pararhizobium polonicum]